MSDSEDGRDDGKRAKGPSTAGGPTPRASQRACDSCRAKKIKCDGPSMDDRICTNCRQYGLSCQYIQQAKKRGPPKGYIESVEARLARMENLLNRLAPGADFTPELGARIDKDNFDLATHRQFEPTGNARVTSPVSAGGGGPGPSSRTSSQHAADQPSQTCSSTEAIRPWLEDGTERGSGGNAEEDPEESALLEALQKVQLGHQEIDKPLGFTGKSSSFNLLMSARDYKYGTVGAQDNFIEGLVSNRRPFFWKMPPWEDSLYISEHAMPWPPEDLVPKLVDDYFFLIHHALPLLHEPTFRRDLTDRVYERDRDFRQLCLTVFALGSRSCNDERMHMPASLLPPDMPELYRRYSAGWQLIGQIMSEPFDWNAAPNLFDLQKMVLLISFLQGGSHPRIGWTLIGVGLRNCIDLGLHREHVLKTKPKAEAELWRRAFWALYALDRTTAGIMGRPLAIHDEDIDIDYPLDVDDEHWETGDPARDFVQPADKPSRMSGFIASLKLMQINGYCLRTVYCINKAKLMLRFNSIEAQQQVVAELDSALNSWLDNIPAHLKWNPHNKDEIFMQQSALLYSAYYATQILVHRPFIPTSSRPSKVAFPSLAICTNAARSGAHVVETARHRPRFHGYEVSTALQAWTFGIVLLINIWGGKKSGSIGDPATARADVDKLKAFFAKLEQRWFLGGRIGDVLRELASQGGMPPPDPANVVPPSHKRPRGATAPSSATASAPAPPAQSFGLSAAPAPAANSGAAWQRKPAGGGHSISKRASADFSHAQALFHQTGQHSPTTHASPAPSIQESTASSSGFADPAIDADIVSHKHLPTLPRSNSDASLGFFGQPFSQSERQQQQQPDSAAAVIDPVHFAAFLQAQASMAGAGGPTAAPAFSSGFPPGGAGFGLPPASAADPSPQTASGFPDWMNASSAGASWPQPPASSAASAAASGEATMDLLFANGTFPIFSPPGENGPSLYGNGTPGLNGAPPGLFPSGSGPSSAVPGLWDNAPAAFEVDDWSSYLSQFGPSDANGR